MSGVECPWCSASIDMPGEQTFRHGADFLRQMTDRSDKERLEGEDPAVLRDFRDEKIRQFEENTTESTCQNCENRFFVGSF